MVNKLFKWVDWDQLDTLEFIYMDVELVVNMGKYPKGTRFCSLTVNYDTGVLLLFEKGCEVPVATVQLKLEVVE